MDFFAADNEGYVDRLVVSLDWHVMAFCAAITIVTVLLFGLMPAMRVSRVDPADSLSLLVAAGLLTRSFARVMASGNLDSNHLAQLRLRPRLVGYTPDRAQEYLARALEAVRRVPGVVDAVPVRGSIGRQATEAAPVALPGEAVATSRNRPELDSHRDLCAGESSGSRSSRDCISHRLMTNTVGHRSRSPRESRSSLSATALLGPAYALAAPSRYTSVPPLCPT